MCIPCSCLLYLKKNVLLWKQLKGNHHSRLFGVGNSSYLLLWLEKHNKSKQKISNTPKDFSLLLSWIRMVNSKLLQQHLLTAKSFWEVSFFSILCFFFFLIFEHVLIGSYGSTDSPLPHPLLPTVVIHLKISWPASFVNTGIYHLGRCLWSDEDRLWTNHPFLYIF